MGGSKVRKDSNKSVFEWKVIFLSFGFEKQKPLKKLHERLIENK